MRSSALVVLVFLLALPFYAQAGRNSGPRTPHKIRISPEVAAKLLIKKVAPVCKHGGPARIIGTVVVGIEIGTHGEVLRPKAISGPALLQRPAIETVEQYKYRPYKFNGKPVEVETKVSVHFDLSSNCP